MWFKQAQLFHFTESFSDTPESCDEKLAADAFTSPQAYDFQKMGWVSPVTHDPQGPLVYTALGCHMLCLKIEEKMVPASVVKQALDERVAHIEATEGRTVRAREKKTLKDDVFNTLLPQAFSRIRLIYGYIDTQKQRLILNTSNTRQCDTFISMMRQAFGPLKLALPRVDAGAVLMTDWITRQALPAGFDIEGSCVIQDGLKEGGFIRCQKQNLMAEDIQALLSGGREIISLGLCWQGQVRFSLDEQFHVKQIRFLDSVLQAAASQQQGEDAALAQFDADFAIMTETFRSLFDTLLNLFAKSTSKAASAEAVYG